MGAQVRDLQRVLPFVVAGLLSPSVVIERHELFVAILLAVGQRGDETRGSEAGTLVTQDAYGNRRWKIRTAALELLGDLERDEPLLRMVQELARVRERIRVKARLQSHQE